jgi:hypothetical protein
MSTREGRTTEARPVDARGGAGPAADPGSRVDDPPASRAADRLHEADRQPVSLSSALALRVRTLLRSPVCAAVLACVALAALSAAVLPTVASYDPWAWIIWGRELTDPHLSFAIGGGPSWKPLPVVFTTVFGLFGGAAPTLWVIAARAGGLLGLVAAWRLARRLTARTVPTGGAVAGAIAGIVAVLGVLLTQDFFYYWFRGTSEPMLVATALWAIDRFLDGRRAQAFVIAVAGALIRPEWWPFLGLYGLWLWVEEPRLRILVVLGFASVPFFWFVPPWLGGEALNAAIHAADYNGHLGNHPELNALARAADLQVTPILVGAVVAVVWTWLRERDRVVLGLAAAALAWIVLVVAMVVLGYPGLERFFLPASAVLCVLGGAGFARVAVALGRRLAGAFDGRSRTAGAIAAAVACVLVAISIPFASSRISAARAAKPTADSAATTLDQLSAAVKAVGGHDGVFPCGSSFAAVNHGVQTALAWKLHVTMGRVGTSMRAPGIDFIGPRNSITGSAPRIDPRLTQSQLLARVGAWRVVRLTDPNHPALDACVGR